MERTPDLIKKPCPDNNHSAEGLTAGTDVKNAKSGGFRIKDKYVLLFIILMFSVGLTGHAVPSMRELMINLTPFTLLLIGLTIILYFVLYEDRKFLLWAALTYIFTAGVEIAGVKTGMIFGTYQYGDVLGAKILDVPLIIGFNWMIIISGTIYIAKRFYCRVLPASLLAAALAVAFDILLEPVALKLNYWSWHNSIIPVQNYIAWFLIAFIAALAYRKLKVRVRTKLLQHYFFIQLFFFLVLNLII